MEAVARQRLLRAIPVLEWSADDLLVHLAEDLQEGLQEQQEQEQQEQERQEDLCRLEDPRERGEQAELNTAPEMLVTATAATDHLLSEA